MRGILLSLLIGTCGLFAQGWSSIAWCQSTESREEIEAVHERVEETPSRAAELEAEREAKAQKLVKPERGSTEKGLYWWDNQSVVTKVVSGWRGFHAATGSFGNGAGLTFGVGFTDLAVGSVYPEDDLPNRVDVDAAAAYSLRNYFLTRAGVTMRNIGSAPVDLSLRGRIYDFPEEDFFGLGPDSQKADRTAYRMRSSEVGADLGWRPGRGFGLTAGAAYLNPRIASGTDPRYPSTEEIFDPVTVPGFSTQPNYLRFTSGFSFDYRDNPALPRKGGFYRLRYADYQGQDLDAFDFRQLQVDLEQYVPLPHKYRILALRASAVLSDAEAGHDVPFYYQPTLGGSEKLRGFRESRFRDRNSILLSAEYRWQAWWALDMALFVDAGKVAYNRSDLDLNHLEASYGLGLRFHSNRAFAGRLDLSFSREGFIPFLRFVYVF